MLNYEPGNRPDFRRLYEELAEWNLPDRLIAGDRTEEQLTDQSRTESVPLFAAAPSGQAAVFNLYGQCYYQIHEERKF